MYILLSPLSFNIYRHVYQAYHSSPLQLALYAGMTHHRNTGSLTGAIKTPGINAEPLQTSCFKVCVRHIVNANNSRGETDGWTWGGGRICSLAWRKQEVQRLNSGHAQHLDQKSNLDLYWVRAEMYVQHQESKTVG